MKQPPFPNQPPRYVGKRRRRSDQLRDAIDQAVAGKPDKISDDELEKAFDSALAEDSEDEP